ncbi:MAG: hypothetical protein OEU46_16320 [Alphaproteobacteria bacterium]|nr:hypothetical protein [Alphaproteobacteria bacterium]
MPCFESLFQILWTFGLLQHPQPIGDIPLCARKAAERSTEDTAATRGLVLLPYLLFDLSAAIIEIDATPSEDESAKAIRAFAVHAEGGNEQGERGDAG